MTTTDKFYANRVQMVNDQIRDRGIRNQAILEAMIRVQRHLFCLPELQHYAYADTPLSIGFGQTISQPYIVAYMSEALQIIPGDTVLEVGSGCGYQTAILCELGATVYGVEIIKELALASRKRLAALNYKAEIHHANGYNGLKSAAPFDKIICGAAPPTLPQVFATQLKENGLVVVPVGDYSQNLLVLKKQNNVLVEQSSLPVRFVPMVKGPTER